MTAKETNIAGLEPLRNVASVDAEVAASEAAVAAVDTVEIVIDQADHMVAIGTIIMTEVGTVATTDEITLQVSSAKSQELTSKFN